jgi:predicted enzyme related to lactoylglutathione lyase
MIRAGTRSGFRGDKKTMTALKFRSVAALLVPALVVGAYHSPGAPGTQESPAPEARATEEEMAVQVQYLEVVTADVDATCSALEKLHGVRFGEPEAALGNARTATLEGGGRVGVRAPMREDEDPVVRPYLLVDDIEAAVKTAQAAGGDFAMTATEIPGHGEFAIYFLGGVEYGLWEL